MFFRGEYEFLSNFFPCEIRMEGMCFANVEAAFQAMKCPERASEFVGLTGGQAKKLGRKVELRNDWEAVKLDVMEQMLRIKYSDPVLMKKLCSIEGEIAEDNYWHDTYWGRCRGKGQNHLGKLLMKIRDEEKEV